MSSSAGTEPALEELSQFKLRQLIEREYQEAKRHESRGSLLWLSQEHPPLQPEQKAQLVMEYERAVYEEVGEAGPDGRRGEPLTVGTTSVPVEVVTHSSIRLSFEDDATDKALDMMGSIRLAVAKFTQGIPALSSGTSRHTTPGSSTFMQTVRSVFSPEVSNLTSATTVASALVDDLENGENPSDHGEASRSVARERLARLRARLNPLIESLRSVEADSQTGGDAAGHSSATKASAKIPEDARTTVEALLAHTRAIYATIALRHRTLAANREFYEGPNLPGHSLKLEMVEKQVQLADHLVLKVEAALEAIAFAEGSSKGSHPPIPVGKGTPNCGVPGDTGQLLQSDSVAARSRGPMAADVAAVSSKHSKQERRASAAEKALEHIRRARGSELYHAVRSRDTLTVHTLLLEPELVNVNACDEQHNTPLHLAIALGDVGSTHAILNHPEVDANRTTRRKRWTPLHVLAARRAPPDESMAKQHQLVRVVLQSGKADMHAKTIAGDTPVQLAARKGNAEMVRMLEGELRRRESSSSSPQEGEICAGSESPHTWLRREEHRFQEQWDSQVAEDEAGEARLLSI
eukprot:scaffold88864_cov35-Tisochrysis_lutea.AAC.2